MIFRRGAQLSKMSLQLYQPVQKVEEGALVVLPNGQQITEAQYEKRLKDVRLCWLLWMLDVFLVACKLVLSSTRNSV